MCYAGDTHVSFLHLLHAQHSWELTPCLTDAQQQMETTTECRAGCPQAGDTVVFSGVNNRFGHR